MIVAAFRIVQTHLAGKAFDGEGAHLYGGRWNSKGRRMVYTSSSLALATLEVFVHLESHEVIGRRYCSIRAEIPDKLIAVLDTGVLVANWRDDPPINQTKNLGDAWLDGLSTAVLQVPSSLIPGEANLLINPLHPDFGKITIATPEPYAFSGRLLK